MSSYTIYDEWDTGRYYITMGKMYNGYMGENNYDVSVMDWETAEDVESVDVNTPEEMERVFRAKIEKYKEG